MLTPSTLSLAAAALRRHLGTHTGVDPANVLLGHPAHVTPTDGAQAVSAYFFRVFPAGDTGAVDPTMPLDAVAHCLITPLGSATTSTGSGNDVSVGENDLAILGQVMQCMHEHPYLRVTDASANGVCDVEIAPLDLTVDEISKIVPTAPAKGGFRPSAAYALALLPLPHGKERPLGAPVEIVTVDVKPIGRPDPTFPGARISGITAPEGEALPEGNTELPHLQLELKSGRRVYFARFAEGAPTGSPTVKVGIPAATAQPGPNPETVKVIQHRWSPETGSYVPVREKSGLEVVDREGAWEASSAWSLDSTPPGQYLLRAERTLGGEVRVGNVCVLAITPRSDSP